MSTTMVTPHTLGKLYFAMFENRNLRRVIYFLDPKVTAKLTRQQRVKGRTNHETYLLTVGTPNFVERALVKTLVKAGESFPVKKLKLQEFPVAKPKKAVKK